MRYWLVGGLALLVVLLAVYQGGNIYFQSAAKNHNAEYVRHLIEEANVALVQGEKSRAAALYEQIAAEPIDDNLLRHEMDKLALQLTEPIQRPTSLAQRGNLAQLYNEANLAFSAQDWPKAIELYEQIRADDVFYKENTVKSELLEAYLTYAMQILAQVQHQDNELDQAAIYLQKVLRLVPGEPTALEESYYLNIYLSAQRALRGNAPEEAVDLLLPLFQQPRQYLSANVSNLLFRAYVILGDLAIRKSDIVAGEQFYQEANRIEGPDKTNLQRRLNSLSLLERPTSTPEPVAFSAPAVVEPVIAAPEVPTPTPTPLPTPVPVTAPVCADARSVLREPGDNSILSGVVTFTGTATHEALQYYKLDFAPLGTAVYAYFAGSEQPVENGVLGTLDTRALANGGYALRLVVVDRDGNYPPPCEIHVTIAN